MPLVINDDPEHSANLETIVSRAITETQGQDRVIEEISEVDIGASFPAGTTLFVVVSKSTECPHEPPCTWYDSVFHGNGRCVIVVQGQDRLVSIGSVIHCLTEPS